MANASRLTSNVSRPVSRLASNVSRLIRPFAHSPIHSFTHSQIRQFAHSQQKRPPGGGGEGEKKKKKKPAASYSRTGESRTTLGDGALNFRVRNGNGCDNSSMATGKKPFSWELKRLTTHNEMRGMISHHVKF